MAFEALPIGLLAEKLSRRMTGTEEVCAGRSIVATGTGVSLGYVAASGAVTSASVLGLAGVAAVAAPVVMPLAVGAGAVALVRSLFD